MASMALLTQLSITHICHALAAQELVVAKLQAELETLKDAETFALFIDVDAGTPGPTVADPGTPGPTVAEWTERLESAQSHLRHLQGKFNAAKYYWHLKEYHLTLGQPWLRLRPNPPPPAPPTPTLANDPSVSIVARASQYRTGPTIDPRLISYYPPAPLPQTNPRVWRKHAWWLKGAYTETFVFQTGERIRYCPKRYARPGYVAPMDRFVDVVARQKAGEENIGFRVMSGEEPDADCDPKFWEKQLWAKGDIFGKRAGLFERRSERVEEEELAPDQMPGAVAGGTETRSPSAEDVEMVDADEEVGMYSQKEMEGVEWGSGGSATSSDGELKVPNFEAWTW